MQLAGAIFSTLVCKTFCEKLKGEIISDTSQCIDLNQKYFPAQIYAVNLNKKEGISRTPYLVFYNPLGIGIAWFKGRYY